MPTLIEVRGTTGLPLLLDPPPQPAIIVISKETEANAAIRIRGNRIMVNILLGLSNREKLNIVSGLSETDCHMPPPRGGAETQTRPSRP